MKLLATLSTGAAMAFPALACSISTGYQVTFFGYPDNDPPGPATAYNCGGRNFVAGGTGTYKDPVTIATALGELRKCEIVWIPILKKYGRHEDLCGQCNIDYRNGLNHIDVWIGSATTNGGQSQINCENRLTPSERHGIVRDPPSTFAVNTAPLFSPPSTCNTGNVFKNEIAHC